MNKIWFSMVILSICTLFWTSPNEMLSVMMNASNNAFKLSLDLCAVYAVWLGVLEIVEASGISEKLANCLRPFIKKIFKINNSEAEKYIALNMSANMLGLGNASTPMGLKALKTLDKGNEVASHAIIMLIVLNATSIQLLPSTIIGLRTSAGSENPADIIFPTLLATICTFILGILLVCLCTKIREKLRGKNI